MTTWGPFSRPTADLYRVHQRIELIKLAERLPLAPPELRPQPPAAASVGGRFWNEAHQRWEDGPISDVLGRRINGDMPAQIEA